MTARFRLAVTVATLTVCMNLPAGIDGDDGEPDDAPYGTMYDYFTLYIPPVGPPVELWVYRGTQPNPDTYDDITPIGNVRWHEEDREEEYTYDHKWLWVFTWHKDCNGGGGGGGS